MLDRVLPPRGPGRTLAVISLFNTIGSGLWVVSSALYLTRFVGLTPTEVGVGFSVAAVVCLVASTPMGYLADSRGPRRQQVLFYLLLACAYGAMLLVTSLWSFVLVASFIALADAGQRGARGALIAGLIPKEQRVRARAYNRTMANAGYAVGAAVGGGAIALGSVTAYRLLIVGNVVSFVVIAVLAARLPHLKAVARKAAEPRLRSLRDRPYLTFVALDGLIGVHNEIPALVLPLWIVGHTGAPAWLVAVCLIVNTLMVVLLQVRTSRDTETVEGSLRAVRSAGLLIAVACVVFAASAGLGAAPATILVVAGTVIHVLGELRHSAAGWGLSFGLAPPDMQGQYQSTYAMGSQLGQIIAPVALTFLVLGLGTPGWIVLAVLVVAPALAMRPVVAWKLRRDPPPRDAARDAPAATNTHSRAATLPAP